jgi:choline-glycine betaine transporter
MKKKVEVRYDGLTCLPCVIVYDMLYVVCCVLYLITDADRRIYNLWNMSYTYTQPERT